MRGRYKVAEIVGAFAASHTPLFLLRHDAPAEEVREEVFSSYRRMASEIVARGAEAMVLLGNDHLHAFSMDRYPALGIGVGPKFGPVETEPFSAGRRLRGRRGAGLSPLRAACWRTASTPWFAGNWRWIIPSSRPWRSWVIRVSPSFRSFRTRVAPPLPPAVRSYELGVSLRQLLESYAGYERVAVVATGRALALDRDPRAGRHRRGVGP